MEEGAGEGGDAPRGHGQRVVWVRARVADQVAGLVIAMVLDNVAGAGALLGAWTCRAANRLGAAMGRVTVPGWTKVVGHATTDAQVMIP
jgi:hypothetical protein